MNYSPGNFDIVIFVYVFITSLKIVCVSSGYHLIWEKHGLKFRIPVSNVFCIINKRTSYWVNQNCLQRFRNLSWVRC